MTNQQRQEIVLDFVEFAKNKLDIKQLPKIEFVNNRNWAVKRHSFGQYNGEDKALQVYIGNRNLADVLRTLGHELVHHRQNELGMIKPGSGDTGSEIENQANSLAGVMMRDYGRINDLIYETVIPSLKQIYEAEKSGRIQIYCDMDGVLCDFDSRFEHYYGVPPREYAKEKGQKAMEEAVDKVGVVYWSKMPWLKGGRELWAKISKYDPVILTSPGKFIYAREGKLKWIQENLSPQPKDIIFANTGKKFEAIKDKSPEEIRSSMLIDDYWPNLAPWKEIGGIAIMYKSFEGTSNILDKFRLKEAKKDNASKNDTTIVHGIYDPDYADYGLVLFKIPKQVKDFAKYGLKNAELLTGKDFKKKYIEFKNKKLQKVIYTKKLKLGSNIGEGEYWCTNDYCIEIYSGQTPDSREYAKYVDKIVDYDLPNDFNILVKEGFVDDIRFN